MWIFGCTGGWLPYPNVVELYPVAELGKKRKLPEKGLNCEDLDPFADADQDHGRGAGGDQKFTDV